MTDTERCDREIAEILERPDVVSGQAPAWLVAMGVADWEAERRLIVEKMERHKELAARYMREANGATWLDWIEGLLLAAEERIAELTADEEPRKAAERIALDFMVTGVGIREMLVNSITTAIQAASNAQLERGRAKIAELESEIEHQRGYIDGLKHTAQVSVEDAYANRHIQHVREFMAKFSQHIGEAPGFPPQEVLDLRIRLMAEEFAEMLEAAGLPYDLRICMHGDGTVNQATSDQIYARSCLLSNAPDFPAFIRELLDLEKLILGTHIACGVDPAEPWARVCSANAAKTLRAGQPVKPWGWVEPDIAGALREQGWQGGAE